LTKRGDDRDAGDQDQSQHDGVLHRCGAVIADQKLAELRTDLRHELFLEKRDVKFRSPTYLEHCTLFDGPLKAR
jgi:hypothetical protein